MAFFASEKKTVLSKIKKRAWTTPSQQKELFDMLAEQELKVGEVIWMLADPDRMVRQYATSIILSHRMPGAAVAVLGMMKEASGATRSYLLNILPKLGDDSVFEQIERLLSSKHASDREIGIDVVLAYPIQHVKRFLLELVKHDKAEYRYRALQRFLSSRVEGQPLAKDIVQVLRELAEDREERIRIRCFQALAETPTPELAGFLVERFVHESHAAKSSLVKLLEGFMADESLGMVDRLLPLLSQDDDMVRATCLNLTLSHSDPVDIIRKILVMSDDLMGWMRERILRTMQEYDKSLVAPVMELLEHADPEVRKKALIFASDLLDEAMVVPVSKLLSPKEDWWTRIIAMDLLGRLKDERAVDPLMSCLQDDDTRWSAVEALSRIGSPKALGPIARLLGDKSPEVRMQVINAMELYNDPRALPLLKKSMERDPNVDVRESALAAYREIAEKNKQKIDEKQLRKSFGYAKTERRVDKLLTETRRVGASDLHVMPHSPPTIRISGKLKKIGEKPFSSPQTQKMIMEILDGRHKQTFDDERQVDFCYTVPGVGRYRTNVYEEKNGIGAVFRVIPNEVPTFLEVGLPDQLSDVVNYHQGMVVVTGPAGSGKSTTLAAFVNLINESKQDHILTLEDPIEIVHPYKKSLVNQREIGKHSKNFHSALRAALREDPDVIVVGELRDPETMTLAMEAAETGHIVITTMNTTSAAKTVDRLVDAFPPKEQTAVRMMLSESLQIVTSQSLVPRADGKGRVPVFEVLMVTGPIKNLIRDNKTQHIPSAMTVGRDLGMQTVDMALEDLFSRGLITAETAYRRSERKEVFEAMVSKEFLEGYGGL